MFEEMIERHELLMDDLRIRQQREIEYQISLPIESEFSEPIISSSPSASFGPFPYSDSEIGVESDPESDDYDGDDEESEPSYEEITILDSSIEDEERKDRMPYRFFS
jgi:hypothetical protein